MSGQLPASGALTTEARLALITAAQTAPSGDNCQPLRFAWDSGRLTITTDQVRAEHPLNIVDTSTLLTLGATLECLSIEASRLRMQTSAEVTLGTGSDGPSAVVSFTHDGRAPDPLCSYLAVRRTDRRLFCKGVVPSEVAKSDSSTESAAVHWLPQDERRRSDFAKLARFVAQSETEMWRNQKIHAAFYQWLRFGRSGAVERDGMPVATLAVSPVEALALRCGRSFAVQRCLNASGGLWLAERHTRATLRSAAALFCISVPIGSGLAGLPDAGRVALRTWLQLTAHEFGVQPQSIVSLAAFAHGHAILPKNLGPRFQGIGEEALPILRETLGIPADHLPIWLFRTGDVRGLPPAAHCPRLPVDAVY